MEKDANGLTRRSFLKGAGVGAVAGAAAVAGAGALTSNEAKAALEVNSVTPYESVMVGHGRTYARAKKCEGPVGYIAFENEDKTGAVSETIDDYKDGVIVVGGGITGMLAALHAADLGKKVLVLEKMTAARGIGEDFTSIGSKFQVGEAVDADGDGVKEKQLHHDKTFRMSFTKRVYDAAAGRLRRGPVHSFVEYSGEAIDFFRDMLHKGASGFDFAMPGTGLNGVYPSAEDREWYCNLSIPANLNVGFMVGRPMLHCVRELAWVGVNRYSDLFKMRLSTPVVQLIRSDNNKGKITGLIAKHDDKYIRYNCERVILATGGYDANPDLMASWCRSEDYGNLAWWNGAFGTTGDGHMMGLRAGALLDPTPHAIMSFADGNYVGKDTHFNRFTYIGLRRSAIGVSVAVNRHGKRFTCEDVAGQNETSFTVNGFGAQENWGKDVWLIGNTDPGASKQALKDEYSKAGHYYEGSLEEIAEKCHIDLDGLKETLRIWNEDVDSPCTLTKADGTTIPVDREFGREMGKDMNGNTTVRQPDGTTAPLDCHIAGPIYYALKPANGYLLTTVSGLQVNENFQVLDAETEEPIEGLYAGGNVSGCFFYGYYPKSISGISIGRAITSGYLAAQHACTGRLDHADGYPLNF